MLICVMTHCEKLGRCREVSRRSHSDTPVVGPDPRPAALACQFRLQVSAGGQTVTVGTDHYRELRREHGHFRDPSLSESDSESWLGLNLEHKIDSWPCRSELVIPGPATPAPGPAGLSEVVTVVVAGARAVPAQRPPHCGMPPDLPPA